MQLEAIGNSTGRDEEPQVTAVGNSGEYVVTWYGQDSGGDYSVFVQQFAADGTILDLTITNTDSVPVQSSETGVAYGTRCRLAAQIPQQAWWRRA